jgi:hypothetical protein
MYEFISHTEILVIILEKGLLDFSTPIPKGWQKARETNLESE